MTRTAGIIQARMGSTRLPGKVLATIAGRPLLWYVVKRAARAEHLDEVAVATSVDPRDDAIESFCVQREVPCFRGSEHDVLERYCEAARWLGAEVIVRITGDCPLVDPDVIDRVAARFAEGDEEYVSNVCPPSFPDGLDTEVLSLSTLERVEREADRPSEREHVTAYIREHPDRFRIGNVEADADLSHLRWTVDEPEDLTFVRAVYEHLPDPTSGMSAVMEILEQYPELMDMNRHIGRDEGYAKSVTNDR